MTFDCRGTWCRPVLTSWAAVVHLSIVARRSTEELKSYFNRREELTLERNCLLSGIRAVVHKPLQGLVLEELHYNHSGMNQMKRIARSYVWWPNIDHLSLLSKQSTHSSSCITSTVVLDCQALAAYSCWFCWPIPRQDVPSDCWCSFQMAWSLWDAINNLICHSQSVAPSVRCLWPASSASFRQWSTIHLWRVHSLPQVQWSEAYSFSTISLCL